MINDELFNSCKQILDARFNGVIKSGKHDNYSTCEPSHISHISHVSHVSHECCILELYSIVLNKSWTDDPNILRIFDIRRINDIDVPDSLRTEWMLKLLCAYEGSLDWPVEKQKEVVSKIVILTVNRIISKLPGLDEKTRVACISAKTLEEAKSTAYANAAAYYAAAYYAAAYYAAAASSIATAADANAAAAKEEIFVETCKLWLEAAGC